MTLRAILPSAVVVAETTDAIDQGLLPDEARALGHVSDRRRRDFTAGRLCARRALARLGLPATPILPGPDRAPRWPPGIVGSITHCEGYCAAAVARRKSIAALGIDAEPDAALPDDVFALITRPEERTWLHGRPDSLHWARVIFSAKEAVFKAWSARTGQWLDFAEIRIAIDLDGGGFRAALNVATSLGIDGRYRRGGGLVLTAVAIEA